MLQSNNCEQDLILHIFTCSLSIIFLTFDQKVNKWFQGLEINTLDVETFADRNFRGWLGLIFFADINFRGRPISKYFACINFRGSIINFPNFPNFRQFCSQREKYKNNIRCNFRNFSEIYQWYLIVKIFFFSCTHVIIRNIFLKLK